MVYVDGSRTSVNSSTIGGATGQNVGVYVASELDAMGCVGFWWGASREDYLKCYARGLALQLTASPQVIEAARQGPRMGAMPAGQAAPYPSIVPSPAQGKQAYQQPAAPAPQYAPQYQQYTQYAPQAAPAPAQPPPQFVKTGEKVKLGVLEFTNLAGVTPYEIQTITDMVRLEAGEALPGAWYLIMTRESILQLLPPDRRNLAACEGECEVETGRNIGADYVVTGEVGKFGHDLQVKFKLYNTGTSDYLGGKIVNAADINGLQKPLSEEAARLFEKLKSGGR